MRKAQIIIRREIDVTVIADAKMYRVDRCNRNALPQLIFATATIQRLAQHIIQIVTAHRKSLCDLLLGVGRLFLLFFLILFIRALGAHLGNVAGFIVDGRSR